MLIQQLNTWYITDASDAKMGEDRFELNELRRAKQSHPAILSGVSLFSKDL